VRGWSGIADDLILQGQAELALTVGDFLKRLPPVRTEREWMRDRMVEQAKTRDDQHSPQSP